MNERNEKSKKREKSKERRKIGKESGKKGEETKRAKERRSAGNDAYFKLKIIPPRIKSDVLPCSCFTYKRQQK